MATFSALYPVFSPIVRYSSPSNPIEYGAGVQIGNAINISIAPNYRICSPLAKNKGVFQSAAVALNVTAMPLETYKIMYGGSEDGAEFEDAEVVGNEGGFGYIRGIIEKGEHLWRITWLKCVTFMPPPESAVSKHGGSVTITTPSISGVASRDEFAGGWRMFKTFSDPTEALEELKRMANIK